MGRWILREGAARAPPQTTITLQQPQLEVTLVGGEETLKLALWAWDARPDLLLQSPQVRGSPAVGQQGQNRQQQRDEDQNERQRQDERVQVASGQ